MEIYRFRDISGDDSAQISRERASLDDRCRSPHFVQTTPSAGAPAHSTSAAHISTAICFRCGHVITSARSRHALGAQTGSASGSGDHVTLRGATGPDLFMTTNCMMTTGLMHARVYTIQYHMVAVQHGHTVQPSSELDRRADRQTNGSQYCFMHPTAGRAYEKMSSSSNVHISNFLPRIARSTARCELSLCMT